MYDTITSLWQKNKLSYVDILLGGLLNEMLIVWYFLLEAVSYVLYPSYANTESLFSFFFLLIKEEVRVGAGSRTVIAAVSYR